MSTEPATPRRIFDEAFKRDAVALALKGDKPHTQLAKELGLCAKSLRDWTKLYGPPPPARSAAVLAAELRALRRENEHLRAQRDILKKNAEHPCRTPAARFARMKPLVNQYALADLCAAFDVSPSGHHAWRRRRPGPRLLQALRQQGQRTSRRRVRRLMRQHHLHPQAPPALPPADHRLVMTRAFDTTKARRK